MMTVGGYLGETGAERHIYSITRGKAGELWNILLMKALRTAFALMAVWAALGCEGLPEPKELDQGKVDRAMDQVEKDRE